MLGVFVAGAALLLAPQLEAALVAVEDHRIRSEGGVTRTEMGCPPEVAAHEAWLAALVDDHAQVQLTGSTEGMMFSLDSDAGWIGFLRD